MFFIADINTFSDVNRIYIARRVPETRRAVALLFWQRSAGENGGRFHALFKYKLTLAKLSLSSDSNIE